MSARPALPQPHELTGASEDVLLMRIMDRALARSDRELVGNRERYIDRKRQLAARLIGAGCEPAWTSGADMRALEADGFTVTEVWLDGYYDGLSAKKTVNGIEIEVYAGAADSAMDPTDRHYCPRAYAGGILMGCYDTPALAAQLANRYWSDRDGSAA